MKLRQQQLPASELKLSTFCCGLGDLFALPSSESDALLDAFVEAGGNFFDTAHCYSFWLPGGNGQSEIGIADYLRRRGLTDQVTVATKGGHPSAPGYRAVDYYLSPERIGADIQDSLGRLQSSHVALYYLHRDDERVPVGEIIDSLNDEIERGRLRFLGASNWSTARIAEANDYARANGLSGFIISQPRWSLARAQGGDRTLVDADDEINWYQEKNFPLAVYSPTAHGYFDGNTTGAYDSPRNAARRERAESLARKHNATPGQIALAYLVNQPFPVFPILGTSNVARLREALGADELELTPDETAWLVSGASNVSSSVAGK